MRDKKASNSGAVDVLSFGANQRRASDPTNDFARAMQAANMDEAPESVGLPAIFPESREELEDRTPEEVAPPKEERSSMMANAEDFEAHYRRFDLADPIDVRDLEKINNSIMRDGWLPGREEWIHTKDGGTYVVLKWLERTKPLKKPATEKEVLEQYGIGRD